MVFLLILNVFLLIIGCFLETASAITIVVPLIMLGVLRAIGADPVTRGALVLLSAMPGSAVIIVVSQDVETYLVIAAVERQHGIVEIDHVGLVGVDALQYAVLELTFEGLTGQRGTVLPIPLRMGRTRLLPPPTGLMTLGIELLRIIAFPPLSLAVGLSQIAIIFL